MFQWLKTFLLGYEPNPGVKPQVAYSGNLDYAAFNYQPVAVISSTWQLAQQGWRTHRFGSTNVVLLLPPELKVWFGAQGELVGSEDPPTPSLMATLQQGFEADPSLALDFVEDLAEKRGLTCHTVGSYRCFYDPTPADPLQVHERFFIVGLPGSVVIIKMRGTRDAAATLLLNQIRAAIPHVVGEMK
jgi:hypothetical protein